jgi:hypothetical protein
MSKPSPADRYTWDSGDIEILREGAGEPLLSEEQLTRIIRRNHQPARIAAGASRRLRKHRGKAPRVSQ